VLPKLKDTTLLLTALNSGILNNETQVKQVAVFKQSNVMMKPDKFMFTINFNN